MKNERSATITVGGKQYELLLTTLATKQIAARYGGIEDLGDKLMKSENLSEALDEVCWLIATLANQPILLHNLKHPEDKKDLLTTGELELSTSLAEISEYKDAISEAMIKGTAREIESDPAEDEKAKNK